LNNIIISLEWRTFWHYYSYWT